jgi:hypothetical protein
VLPNDVTSLWNAPYFGVGKTAGLAWTGEPEMAVRIFCWVSTLDELWLVLPDRETPLNQSVGIFLFLGLNEMQTIGVELGIMRVADLLGR